MEQIIVLKLILLKHTNQFCVLCSKLWMRLSELAVFRVACFIKIRAELNQVIRSANYQSQTSTFDHPFLKLMIFSEHKHELNSTCRVLLSNLNVFVVFILVSIHGLKAFVI